ncbi:MAG: glycosyltransferase family 2 protein, partial [Candidatus Omnitrophica bacterium]|nr:glycosyltransferase family 2 protein [Candidatus Omnitrophota bacterium]
VLEKTFVTIQNIDYPNKKVYFLDDSLEDGYKKEAEEIARAHDLVLFRRTRPWHGAKAGIVNDCLEILTEKYIAVFDADQNPMPDFLKVLVPLMEVDEKRAFIQTPQFYSNIGENPIARAAVLQQAVFYEYICEGKGVSDSMFCCGTNVIFRASALKDVGGMDESTVTEDFATSLKFHSKGYRSLYYSHVCAFGMGPEDLIAYFKQQFRWAAGTLSVFKKLLKQFLLRPLSLTLSQWAEYFLSSTYYFVGCAFSILMVCPVIFIFWRIPTFFANPEVYLLAFLPYIILTMSIFYFALRNRNYKPRDLILGQLLGAATFSIYMKAAFAAFLGMKISFGVTSKSGGGAVPYRMLWLQIMVLIVNFIAVVWAVNRFVYEHNNALLVNAFWAFYHFLVFSSIFYFNRETK